MLRGGSRRPAAGADEFVFAPWAFEPVPKHEPPRPVVFELEPLPELQARIHKAEPTPTMNPSPVHAGLDIAKATLDLHLQGQSLSFAHDPPGCAALIARLHALDLPVLVICEATGGWERPIVDIMSVVEARANVRSPEANEICGGAIVRTPTSGTD